MTGKSWGAVLVGPWLPQPPTVMSEGAAHWAAAVKEQEGFAGHLSAVAEHLGRNQGVTADNLIRQYREDSIYHLDLAEKYQEKSEAFASAATIVAALIHRLDDIASAGSAEINRVLASSADPLAKDLELQAIETRCHGEAAAASAIAEHDLTAALGRILRAEGVISNPSDWLRAHGFGYDQPKQPTQARPDSPALSDIRHAPSAVTEAASLSDTGSPAPPAAATSARTDPPTLSDVRAAAAPVVHGGDGVPVTGAHSAGTGVATSGGHGPALPAATPPAAPPISPAAALTEGATAGRPAAAGTQAITQTAVQASTPPGRPTPTSPLVSSEPTVFGGGSASVHSPNGPHMDTPAVPAASAPAAAPVIQPVPMAVSGPVPPNLAAATPPHVGTLPAYGADIRPVASLAPPVQAAGVPLGGTPVAGPTATAPSAGSGPVVSSMRPAPAAAAGGAGDLSARATAAAAAGAVAGDAAAEAVELDRLERIVAVVARQAPELAWAVGLTADGTTVLTTDVAGGWIPPVVCVPAGVTLLPPSIRRRGLSAADLLGATALVAEHRPHGYVPPASAADPPLTDGPRTGPAVDELGPTLIALCQRCDLERIVHTAARAVTRGGLADEGERRRLDQAAEAIGQRVLAAYASGERGDIATWMLAAAAAAFIAGERSAGHYHLAWATTTFEGEN